MHKNNTLPVVSSGPLSIDTPTLIPYLAQHIHSTSNSRTNRIEPLFASGYPSAVQSIWIKGCGALLVYSSAYTLMNRHPQIANSIQIEGVILILRNGLYNFLCRSRHPGCSSSIVIITSFSIELNQICCSPSPLSKLELFSKLLAFSLFGAS